MWSITILRLSYKLWVMETENSQNVFSVSITHNSKIRELSDENKVMETKLLCAKRILSYVSHHFWVMSYENWELSYGNRLSKQPLKFSVCPFFFFFFFFSGMNSNPYYSCTLIYYAWDKMYCLLTVYRFHDTIHIFKNYFTIVFSDFSFQ